MTVHDPGLVGFGALEAGQGAVAQRFESLRNVIGDTPVAEIHASIDGCDCHVYAKLESHNFTGSIKDRMALRIMEDAYVRGAVREGDVVVEASSGNTGISFAALGRALGHPVRIFMPDWMSRERGLLIRSMGAEVVPVSKEEGGFLGSIELARAFAEAHERAFLPRQFESDANVQAHRSTTGPELLAQMGAAGRRPDAFVAGVGTGGTVMGVGAYLRAELDAVRVHPLEPANSPTLRTGTKVGNHRIQGISDEFVPAIVDLARLDDIVDVWDGDAILMAQLLASRLGFAVGISSGANLVGALKLAQGLGSGACVATVFCDSNKKYLSTDLCREEPSRAEYLTPRVRFLGVRVLPRRGPQAG